MDDFDAAAQAARALSPLKIIDPQLIHVETDFSALEASVADLRVQVRQRNLSFRNSGLRDACTAIETAPAPQLVKQQMLKGHLAKVYGASWHPDSQHIASAGQEGRVIVWDTFTGNKIHARELQSSWVMACAYAPTGHIVATGGLDNIITLHRIPLGDRTVYPSKSLAFHTGFISQIVFTGDNKILSASGDHTCGVWDFAQEKLIQVLQGHTADVTCVSYSQSDKNIIATGSCDKTARVWDLRSNFCIGEFTGHTADINSIKFMSSGLSFATGSDDASVRLYDYECASEIAAYAHTSLPSPVTGIAFSQSGRLLFAGHEDSTCNIWDTLRGSRIGSLKGHAQRISNIELAPNGSALLTSSWDKTVAIWS